MQELEKIEKILREDKIKEAMEYVKETKLLTSNLLLNEAMIHLHNKDEIFIFYLKIAESIEVNPKALMKIRAMLIPGYLELASIHLNYNQYNKAIDDCNNIINISPFQAEAYSTRGFSKGFLGHFNEAITDCALAIKMEPQVAKHYYYRGTIYSEYGKFSEAINDLSRAIEIKSDLIPAYNNRGNAYAHLKLFKEALEDYHEIIKLNPNHFETYLHCGNIYFEMQNCERAMEYYEMTLKLNPKYAMAFYGIGNIYSQLKNFSSAIEYYNKAIELDPFLTGAYLNRATEFERLGQYEEALENFDKVIEIHNRHEESYITNWEIPISLSLAHNNRGNVYGHLEKYGQAIDDYLVAINLCPDNSLAHRNLGMVYLIINQNLENSLKHLKKAKFLFKENEEKEEMLAFIAWVNARKCMNNKEWNKFREYMKESKEYLINSNNPLSEWIDSSIEFSFLDERLDYCLSILEPNEAIKNIMNVLDEFIKKIKISKITEVEGRIFLARIKSFAVLLDYLNLILDIDENSNLDSIKVKIITLCKICKNLENEFENINFIVGKRAIVDIEDIINRDGNEAIENIENISVSFRKEVVQHKLMKSWIKLGAVIKTMNGISSYETQNVILQKQIFNDVNTTMKIMNHILTEQRNSRAEHDEILKVSYETKDYLIKENIANMTYRIEIKAPIIHSISPIAGKLIIDIPIGNLTEDKMIEIESKFKLLTKKGKEMFLKALKKMKNQKEIIKRLTHNE